MMKVLRSMKETPSVFSAAWNTTEHSGALVFLSTPQRNLHIGLAIPEYLSSPFPYPYISWDSDDATEGVPS
jgi:hypothetical protein